jgi:hypothetical protein
MLTNENMCSDSRDLKEKIQYIFMSICVTKVFFSFSMINLFAPIVSIFLFFCSCSDIPEHDELKPKSHSFPNHLVAFFELSYKHDFSSLTYSSDDKFLLIYF